MMHRRLAGASSAEQENGQALRPASFDDPSIPVPLAAYAALQRPLDHSDGVPDMAGVSCPLYRHEAERPLGR